MSSAISTWVQRRLFWVALLLATIALGWSGYRVALPTDSPLLSLYHTARLFTLNLDLQPPKDPEPGPALWVAAWLAPILLVRGVAELFRDRLHGFTGRFLVRRRAVVFGGGESVNALVRAARLTWWRRWWKAVVVADLDQAALSAARDLGAWTVTADGLTPDSLRKAAVARSSVVVVMTGDDRRNAMIATEAAKIMPSGKEGQIYVDVGSPVLARTLERSGLEDNAVETTSFSPLVLAAADVMDELDRSDAPLFVDDGAPSVVLFGQGPLVDAVVLELRRRQRVRLVERSESGLRKLPGPRVLLIGPNAEKRRKQLKTLLGAAELNLLEIEAVDDPLTQAVELGESTARALLGRDRSRFMVLAPDDLSGGTIALTVARHLGGARTVTLVTEGPDSSFGRHIEQRSADDPTMADVRVFAVPALACSLRRIEDHRSRYRLARALYEADGAAPNWNEIDKAEREDYGNQADALVEDMVAKPQASAFMAFDPPQVILLSQLGFDDFMALARAGLAPELRDPDVLKKAGRTLLKNGKDMALPAWCEVARLSSAASELTDPPDGPGAIADDIRDLLLLRRAQLDDQNAKLTLAARHVSGPDGDVVVVLGGGPEPASAELRDLLGQALATPPFRGTVFAPEWGGVGELLRDLAAATGFTLQPLDADLARAGRQIIDLLIARVNVTNRFLRVLVVPGSADMWALVHPFRALGVPVAWLPVGLSDDQRQAPERMLLGGAAGVVELPVDWATVRAYLQPSRWPRDERSRDEVAAALHQEYVKRQLGVHKDPDDPALRPFDQLAPALQDSNRAVVDDIPTKLAVVGLHLCEEADAAWPTPWPPDRTMLDRLAEMEHGRFNAERLLRGWRSGNRDTGRFVSPHLLRWADLEDKYREWDRSIITDLPEVLGKAHLGAS